MTIPDESEGLCWVGLAGSSWFSPCEVGLAQVEFVFVALASFFSLGVRMEEWRMSVSRGEIEAQ